METLETLVPDVIASVLLAEDGRLRVGAAPGLPPELSRAIDGMPIGSAEGSRGTAAFGHRIVVAADIATDPLWERYRDLALPHGLRACWSAPIAVGDEVLGALALYHREPRGPEPQELALVERAVSLAGIAIGRARAERRLPGSEERHRTISPLGAAQDVTDRRRAEEELERSLAILRGTLDATADGILVVDATGRIVTHNRRFAEMWRIPDDVLASGDDGRAIAFVLDQLVDPDGFVSRVKELYADSEAESWDVLEFRDRRVLERYTRPHRFADGTVGRVCSFRDATERRRGEAAVRAAQERYRELLEGLPAVVYLAEFGESGPWRYVSPRIEQLLGFTPDEWMADPDLWYRRIHPDDRERAAAEEARARATGEPLRTEYRMLARDGREVWVRDEAVVVSDEEGRPRLLQGVMSDVTDRRRIEEELRRQKEELVALHETALGLIERLDVTSLLETVVARAAALVGTQHGYLYVTEGDELVFRVGTGLFAGFVGTRISRGAGLGGRVWERGEALTVDDYSSWAGRHPLFGGIPARAVAGIPLWAGGEVAGVIGVARLEEGRSFGPEEVELLERFGRLASLALENARLYQAIQSELGERRQAEERYRQIFENAVVGIYQTTLDGRFVTANPAAARMLGYGSPEELIASVEDAAELYVDPGGRHQFIEEMRRAGEAGVLDFEIRRRDGTTIWVSDKARALHDPEGRLVGFEGTLIDITEQKRADEALRQAYERERQAAEGLRTLDEMKNAFMAAVSHELRTPLSSILGFAVTLERDDVRLSREEQRDLLTRLAFNARKLDRLLSDLLDLDRLNRGILQPHLRPSDLADLVRRALAECDFLGSRRVEVELERVVVPVDASKVERIVENLLANAAKHTPADSPIWVRLVAQEGGALLIVEDAGPGVPSELRSKIFEPFHRGAPVGYAPGTGIGLSLVDRFAALHGGSAWVEDRPGGGASFRVFLPGT